MHFDYNRILVKFINYIKPGRQHSSQALHCPAQHSTELGLVGSHFPSWPSWHPQPLGSGGWYVPGARQPWLTGTTLQLTARSHHCSCWALCRCAPTLGAGQNLQDKEPIACWGSHGAPCPTTHFGAASPPAPLTKFAEDQGVFWSQQGTLFSSSSILGGSCREAKG